jgi:hypothetical protein
LPLVLGHKWCPGQFTEAQLSAERSVADMYPDQLEEAFRLLGKAETPVI